MKTVSIIRRVIVLYSPGTSIDLVRYVLIVLLQYLVSTYYRGDISRDIGKV